MNSLEYTSNHTPDGEFHVIVDERGIARVSGFGDIENLATRLPVELRSRTLKSTDTCSYQKYVDDYYDGNTIALDAIPREQMGGAFQKNVWAAMSKIPYGTTVSYKELADIAGNSRAIRAAGTACSQNRLVLLIPCHRVLKSDGSIGNYVHGNSVKESLLRREGAIQ